MGLRANTFKHEVCYDKPIPPIFMILSLSKTSYLKIFDIKFVQCKKIPFLRLAVPREREGDVSKPCSSQCEKK